MCQFICNPAHQIILSSSRELVIKIYYHSCLLISSEHFTMLKSSFFAKRIHACRDQVSKSGEDALNLLKQSFLYNWFSYDIFHSVSFALLLSTKKACWSTDRLPDSYAAWLHWAICEYTGCATSQLEALAFWNYSYCSTSTKCQTLPIFWPAQTCRSGTCSMLCSSVHSGMRSIHMKQGCQDVLRQRFYHEGRKEIVEQHSSEFYPWVNVLSRSWQTSSMAACLNWHSIPLHEPL